jgi:hypothetical protein
MIESTFVYSFPVEDGMDSCGKHERAFYSVYRSSHHVGSSVALEHWSINGHFIHYSSLVPNVRHLLASAGVDI